MADKVEVSVGCFGCICTLAAIAGVIGGFIAIIITIVKAAL